jgi:hypothetical protein
MRRDCATGQRRSDLVCMLEQGRGINASEQVLAGYLVRSGSICTSMHIYSRWRASQTVEREGMQCRYAFDEGNDSHARPISGDGMQCAMRRLSL